MTVCLSLTSKRKPGYKLEFASSPEFSKDNQWLAYRIGLPFKKPRNFGNKQNLLNTKWGLLNLVTWQKRINSKYWQLWFFP
jgi:hypothetical protein